jgi:hypothetical protein
MKNNTAFQSARFEAIKRRQKWHIQCWEDTSKGNGFYVEGMEENIHTKDESSRSWEVKVPVEGKCQAFIFEDGAVTPATVHCTVEGVAID